MPNPWSHEHDKDRARERKQMENQGHADDGANEVAKQRLRDAGEVRAVPQPPSDRAYGPKSER